MRLNNDLKSAQDYEFYIRVARFGKCAVVEEPLVKFYQHDEGRITSAASSHRRKTLYKVLVNNADLFSHREALFFKAKVELLTACDCSNLLIGMLQYLRGVCFLLLACMYMSLSVKILYRGASGLILSSCRLSNN